MLLSFTEFYWVLLGFTGFGSPLVLMVDQEEANGGGQSVDGGRHQRRWFVQMMAPQIHQVAHKSRPLIGRQRLLLRRRCCSLVVPVPEKKSRYWSIFLSPVDPRGPPWTPVDPPHLTPSFFPFFVISVLLKFFFFFFEGSSGDSPSVFHPPRVRAGGRWLAGGRAAGRPISDGLVGPSNSAAVDRRRPITNTGRLPSFSTEFSYRESCPSISTYWLIVFRVLLPSFYWVYWVWPSRTAFDRVPPSLTQFYPVLPSFQ